MRISQEQQKSWSAGHLFFKAFGVFWKNLNFPVRQINFPVPVEAWSMVGMARIEKETRDEHALPYRPVDPLWRELVAASERRKIAWEHQRSKGTVMLNAECMGASRSRQGGFTVKENCDNEWASLKQPIDGTPRIQHKALCPVHLSGEFQLHTSTH
eukprot:1142799-Pelagomonas_calceolata.AAC.4